MEIATKESIIIIGKIKTLLDSLETELNENKDLQTFIENIYLLGYNNGRASIIKGGNEMWKDVILPNIKNNDYDKIMDILNNIIKDIEESRKKNPYLSF